MDSARPVADPPPLAHQPCCSAHGVAMNCSAYRRTHFVEVRPCCAADAAALMDVVDATLDTGCTDDCSADCMADHQGEQ